MISSEVIAKQGTTGSNKVDDKKRQQEKKNKLLNISAFWKPPTKGNCFISTSASQVNHIYYYQ